MSGKYWMTGAPIKHTGKVVRPALGDVLRQLGILIVIGAIWLGVVVTAIGLLNPADTGATIAEASVETPVPTNVPPTSLPAASSPTAISTVAATQLPADTPTVAATDKPTVEPPTAVLSPTKVSPTATAVVVASPTADVLPVPTTALITTGGAVSYSRDVQPLFDRICVKCHGGDETKEGLSLKSYADVMAGSDNGPVIEPGDAANSFLIQQVVNGKMPKKGPRLLPAEIRTLSDWVAAGAPND